MEKKKGPKFTHFCTWRSENWCVGHGDYVVVSAFNSLEKVYCGTLTTINFYHYQSE